MSQVEAEATPQAKRSLTRRALAAEQVRMRHYRKALACVKDEVLRQHWTRELDASRGRAARLAIALVEMGESMPIAEDRPDSVRCLMDAMDMALCNGDMPAAEAVARECMTLVDLRCDHMQRERK
jgi:hypothetical protein